MLTPRLQAAADLIDYADSVIDIGTDHGYLPIYLLKTGKVKTACAADIRKGPLENARQTLVDCGISDKEDFIVYGDLHDSILGTIVVLHLRVVNEHNTNHVKMEFERVYLT